MFSANYRAIYYKYLFLHIFLENNFYVTYERYFYLF